LKAERNKYRYLRFRPNISPTYNQRANMEFCWHIWPLLTVWYSHTTAPVYTNGGGGVPTLTVVGSVAEMAAVAAALHRSARILYMFNMT